MTKPLPTDANAHPIPVMGYRNGGAHKASITGAKSFGPFDTATRIITVTASVAMRFRVGPGIDVDATGTDAGATDHYLPAAERDIALNGSRYININGTGDVEISERE